MFLILEVPRNMNSPPLTTLINQDKLSCHEIQLLEVGRQIREDLVRNDDYSNGVPDTYNKFVQIQAQIIDILSTRPCYTPKYSYSSFVSDQPVLIQTGQYTPVEACEIDLIMTKYYALMASVHQCIALMAKLSKNSLNPKSSVEETCLTADHCLKVFTAGYQDFMLLYNNASTKLTHIALHKTYQYVEINPEVFQSIRILHEINTNFILIVKLLSKQDYQPIQCLCLASFKKTEIVLKKLKDLEQKIKPRITSYCILAQFYFKYLGYFAIIKQNEQLIKKEDFSAKKDFYVLTQEVLNLSDDILRFKDVLPQSLDEDFYDYFVNFIKSILEPLAKSHINTYTGLNRKQVQVQTNQELFEDCQPLDYFENFDLCQKF